MIVMTFDLSSSCIGVVFAQLDDRLTYADTLAIVPKPPTAKDFGFTTIEPKVIHSNGQRYKAFLREDEVVISKTEADRRASAMKAIIHNHLLRNIGEQCGRYLTKVRPDVICIERNASFNGVLTTKLLAEIAGGLFFHAGVHSINEFYDWNVGTIRAKIRHDITDFSLLSKEGKKSLDTKWEIHCRLRSYFEKDCPGLFRFDDMTMDESDALAVFYYWYTTKWKEEIK